jgi:hypothetical protein
LASKSEGSAVPAPSSRMIFGLSVVPVNISRRWNMYSARTSADGQTYRPKSASSNYIPRRRIIVSECEVGHGGFKTGVRSVPDLHLLSNCSYCWRWVVPQAP